MEAQVLMVDSIFNQEPKPLISEGPIWLELFIGLLSGLGAGFLLWLSGFGLIECLAVYSAVGVLAIALFRTANDIHSTVSMYHYGSDLFALVSACLLDHGLITRPKKIHCVCAGRYSGSLASEMVAALGGSVVEIVVCEDTAMAATVFRNCPLELRLLLVVSDNTGSSIQLKNDVELITNLQAEFPSLSVIFISPTEFWPD